jgi:hypothetical protein
MPVRRKPVMHACETQTCETQACETQTCETQTCEMHACETQTREMHACHRPCLLELHLWDVYLEAIYVYERSMPRRETGISEVYISWTGASPRVYLMGVSLSRACISKACIYSGVYFIGRVSHGRSSLAGMHPYLSCRTRIVSQADKPSNCLPGTSRLPVAVNLQKIGALADL